MKIRIAQLRKRTGVLIIKRKKISYGVPGHWKHTKLTNEESTKLASNSDGKTSCKTTSFSAENLRGGTCRSGLIWGSDGLELPDISRGGVFEGVAVQMLGMDLSPRENN